jgi:lipopolysaccharide transport system ATP-binding protein
MFAERAPAADGAVAISMQGVSKMYRLYASKGDRLRSALNPFGRVYHREFWALKNITIDLRKGQTIGIVGLNGSGKSTLLQIIASVLQPTTGRLEVDGTIAALIEVGAGINPELTGRENGVLHGTMLGMSRQQLPEHVEKIQAYADIGAFFDQPMKTYSSGMFMRVAFAAAMCADADVMVIDEVLAVGDAKFQEKCFRRFRSLQDAGKTIVLVTHDRSALPRYCTQGVLLHQGELLEVGDPGRVAELYGELISFGQLRPARPVLRADADRRRDTRPADRSAAVTDVATDAVVRAFVDDPSTEDRCADNPTYNKYEHRFGNGHARIIDYLLMDGTVANPSTCRSGSLLQVYLKVLFIEPLETAVIGMTLKNKEGVIAYGVNTDWMGVPTTLPAAGTVRSYCFDLPLNVCAGDWFIDLAVADTTLHLCDNRGALAHVFLMEDQRYAGLVRLDAQFREL